MSEQPVGSGEPLEHGEERSPEPAAEAPAPRRLPEARAEELAPSRRQLLANAGMLGGLVAGYGAFAAMAGAFLYPPAGVETELVFVTLLEQLPSGASLTWRAPSGERVLLSRIGPGETAADFVALSDVCPHLGCKVHAEPSKERFLCPCHQGTFALDGSPTGGPPLEASQALKRFALEVREGGLFVRLPKQARFG